MYVAIRLRNLGSECRINSRNRTILRTLIILQTCVPVGQIRFYPKCHRLSSLSLLKNRYHYLMSGITNPKSAILRSYWEVSDSTVHISGFTFALPRATYMTKWRSTAHRHVYCRMRFAPSVRCKLIHAGHI